MHKMLRNATALTLALTSLLFLPGCGLIFGGSTQSVSLNSTPDNSHIAFKDSGRSVVTPTEVSLERKHQYVLTFEKDGYKPKQEQITHHVRGGIVVLDILTGLVGIVIDAATGGWYGLSPNRLDVTMEKTDTAMAGPSEIHVHLGLQQDKNKAATLNVQSDVPVHVIIQQKR